MENAICIHNSVQVVLKKSLVTCLIRVACTRVKIRMFSMLYNVLHYMSYIYIYIYIYIRVRVRTRNGLLKSLGAWMERDWM